MSDTPRTDEAQFGTGRVSVDFARQLERELRNAEAELSVSNAERDHFRRENVELRQALTGRTVSCSNCNAIAEENATMREAIKSTVNAFTDVTSLIPDVPPWAHDNADKAILKLKPYLV